MSVRRPRRLRSLSINGRVFSEEERNHLSDMGQVEYLFDGALRTHDTEPPVLSLELLGGEREQPDRRAIDKDDLFDIE